MKLSMWILADWLEKYEPNTMIKDGEACITGARILAPNTKLLRHNVYLGHAEEFIRGAEDKVICAQGQNMLILNTSNMDEVLNDVYNAFDFYNGWSDDLHTNIRNIDSLQDIIDMSQEVIDDPVVVYDPGIVSAAVSRQFQKGDVDRDWDSILENRSVLLENLYEYISEFRTIGKSGKVQIFAPEKMKHRGCMKGIYIEGILYGYVFIMELRHRITPGRLQICDYLAEYMAEWIILHPDHEDIWNEQQLMLGLLHGTDISQERIEYLLALNHWDPQSPKRLFLVGGNEQFANMIKPLRIVLGRIFENAIFAYTSEYIAILINMDLIERSFLKRRLAASIEHIYAYCVCSFEFVSLQETAIHFTQCANVMSLCEKKPGEIYDCRDFGLKYLLRELSSPANRSMLHPALGVLSDGKWKKTDLYNTLKTFLLNERNLVKTAEDLNIHRSTLLYRLEKIKSITDIDLDDPCERVYLLISFLSCPQPEI